MIQVLLRGRLKRAVLHNAIMALCNRNLLKHFSPRDLFRNSIGLLPLIKLHFPLVLLLGPLLCPGHRHALRLLEVLQRLWLSSGHHLLVVDLSLFSLHELDVLLLKRRQIGLYGVRTVLIMLAGTAAALARLFHRRVLLWLHIPALFPRSKSTGSAIGSVWIPWRPLSLHLLLLLIHLMILVHNKRRPVPFYIQYTNNVIIIKCKLNEICGDYVSIN